MLVLGGIAPSVLNQHTTNAFLPMAGRIDYLKYKNEIYLLIEDKFEEPQRHQAKP